MRSISIAAVAALAVATFSASAHATTVTATFTGTVASGFDTTGVFGAPNTDLTGETFTAVFTEVDGPGVGQYFPGFQDYLYGGTSNPGTVSPVTGVLTINGFTVNFPGLEFSEVSQSTLASGQATVAYIAEDFAFTGSGFNSDALGAQIASFINSIMPSADYHVPFSYTTQADDSALDNFNIADYSFSTGTYSALVSGSLFSNSVTVTVSKTPVPEPLTLSLFGTALAGAAALRRRRKANTSA